MGTRHSLIPTSELNLAGAYAMGTDTALPGISPEVLAGAYAMGTRRLN